MNNFEKPKYKKYYPPPPMYESRYEYQDINKDPNLRKQFTLFYHRKLLKWIDNDPLFKNINSKNSQLATVDGQFLVYKLLRKFVKNSGINWYDLKDNYDIIKKYLYKSLV